jgi:UDP-N-acetylglucosamine 2-epimerase (non-hydrolysing)
MAPVIQALSGWGYSPRVMVTGQHRELLDQVIRAFNLPVHHDLNLMRPGQSIHDITTAVLVGMRPVLEAEKPDLVLVHGDTTTTFAAALAAYYQRIPVGHVEAGLRTGLRYEPFPEELNRQMADLLSSHLYAATEGAKHNLLREGRRPEDILVTGNTVIDALLQVAAQPYTFADPLLDSLGHARRLILVTAHRRESFGIPFEQICAALRQIVEANPGIELAYPVHPNPNIREVANRILSGIDHLHLIEPLAYLPFVHLLKKSWLVLTDSGGIQEEAPSLNVPVLVMRDATERPEAIAAGAAKLVGTRSATIVAAVQALLDDPAQYRQMAQAANPYGDGQAAQRIAAHIAATYS